MKWKDLLSPSWMCPISSPLLCKFTSIFQMLSQSLLPLYMRHLPPHVNEMLTLPFQNRK